MTRGFLDFRVSRFEPAFVPKVPRSPATLWRTLQDVVSMLTRTPFVAWRVCPAHPFWGSLPKTLESASGHKLMKR